jgi:hypothetical protein
MKIIPLNYPEVSKDTNINDDVLNPNIIIEDISEQSSEYLRHRDSYYLQSINSMIQDRRERKKYALWIFAIITIWLYLILIIIIFTGLNIFKLHDNILITLLSTTTVNVFGLCFIVANYLFPKNIKSE